MANGGTFRGVEVVGPAGWAALHAHPTTRPINDIIHFKTTSFTQGGVNVFRRQEPDPETGLLPLTGVEGFVGWMGLGGSLFQVPGIPCLGLAVMYLFLFQWNPELRIGFSYVPTLLTWFDLFNLKGKEMQQEVVNCFYKIEQAKY